MKITTIEGGTFQVIVDGWVGPAPLMQRDPPIYRSVTCEGTIIGSKYTCHDDHPVDHWNLTGFMSAVGRGSIKGISPSTTYKGVSVVTATSWSGTTVKFLDVILQEGEWILLENLDKAGMDFNYLFFGNKCNLVSAWAYRDKEPDCQVQPDNRHVSKHFYGDYDGYQYFNGMSYYTVYNLWRFPQFGWSAGTCDVDSITRRRFTTKLDRQYYDWLIQPWFSASSYTDGDLCQAAVADCKAVDINSLAYLKELPGVFSTLKDWGVDLYRSMSLDPKAIASLILNSKYGTRLTIADTRELRDAIWTATSVYDSVRKGSVVRSRTIEDVSAPYPDIFGSAIGKLTKTCKVRYCPMDNTFLQLFKTLSDWDMDLSLQNTWDLIPFSFVIDWFIQVEDILKKIDYHTYASTLNVLEVEYGSKLEIPLSASGHFAQSLVGPQNVPFCGSHANFVRYSRRIEHELAYPPLQLGFEFKPDFLAAGALIIQMISGSDK